VVCLGDSITRGAYLPDESTFPAQLQQILQNTTVINAGVPGNTSTAGLLRFDKDVAPQHPQYVVLFFGTNDSVLRENGTYKVPLEKFTKNLQELITRTRALNAQSVLCTLLPILPEPYFKRHPEEIYKKEGGLEAILQRYRTATLDVGKAENIPVVDLYTTFSKDLSLLRPAPDGVHPTAQGAQVIAREVAKVITK
jgi:lysophospholipase L1-like esterase